MMFYARLLRLIVLNILALSEMCVVYGEFIVHLSFASLMNVIGLRRKKCIEKRIVISRVIVLSSVKARKLSQLSVSE